MNVFVTRSVVGGLNSSIISPSVASFIVTDLIRLMILVVSPILATWRPSLK